MQWYLKRKTIIKKKKNLKASYKERFKISLVTQERQRKIWDSKKNLTPDPLTRQAIYPLLVAHQEEGSQEGEGGGKESLEQERKLIWCDKKTFCFFLHQSFTPPINNCWISRLIFISYFIKISSNIYFLIQQTLG